MNMKLLPILLSTSVAFAAPLPFAYHDRELGRSEHHIPTVEEAAQEVRTLVHRESLANLVTVVQKGDLKGTPEAFMEYYADCGEKDGSLIFLGLNISSSFRNIAAGSPASLSIRVGDHPLIEHVNPKYPGSIPPSPAGSPRVSLRGKFVAIDDSDEKEKERLSKCFVRRHRDAKFWLPGNKIHNSFWTKFEVDGVYFVGGFGDRAYIGEIPADLYKAAKPIHHPPFHHPCPHHPPHDPHHPPHDPPHPPHDPPHPPHDPPHPPHDLPHPKPPQFHHGQDAFDPHHRYIPTQEPPSFISSIWSRLSEIFAPSEHTPLLFHTDQSRVSYHDDESWSENDKYDHHHKMNRKGEDYHHKMNKKNKHQYDNEHGSHDNEKDHYFGHQGFIPAQLRSHIEQAARRKLETGEILSKKEIKALLYKIHHRS